MAIEEKTDGKCMECGADMIIVVTKDEAQMQRDMPLCSSCEEKVRKKVASNKALGGSGRKGVLLVAPHKVLPGTKHFGKFRKPSKKRR